MCSKWQVLCVLWLFVSDTCFLNTAMKGGEIFVQKLSPSTFRSSSPALLRGKFPLGPQAALRSGISSQQFPLPFAPRANWGLYSLQMEWVSWQKKAVLNLETFPLGGCRDKKMGSWGSWAVCRVSDTLWAHTCGSPAGSVPIQHAGCSCFSSWFLA